MWRGLFRVPTPLILFVLKPILPIPMSHLRQMNRKRRCGFFAFLRGVVEVSKRKSSTKTASTITPGGTLTLGLDIGYGVVKAVTDEAAITLPSVMGHAREIKFQ